MFISSFSNIIILMAIVDNFLDTYYFRKSNLPNFPDCLPKLANAIVIRCLAQFYTSLNIPF